jgi:hypothetical protein
MKAHVLGALALAFVVTACSSGGGSTASTAASASAAASPAAQVGNPIDFPLGDGATVLHSGTFHAAAKGESASGTEVVAESTKSLQDLETWLKDASAQPPAGYTIAASGSSIDEAHRHAQAIGVDFAAFTHTAGGKSRKLVIVVLDPAVFDKKAGPALSLVDKYGMLPQNLKDSIDSQVKARTGFTVSEALDPSQPIGAALAAERQMRSSGQRAVVLVDVAKD